MGMFDQIIVPKSYLKGLLKKKDEKLFSTDHTFQTKDLDNALDVYRVYRRRLQRKVRDEKSGRSDSSSGAWENVKISADIKFYDMVNASNGDEYTAEFRFTFQGGKLDKKEALSLTLDMTAADKNKIDKMWNIEQEIFDSYRNSSIKYKTFAFLEKICQKATNWARVRHSLPFKIRKDAYEKSGRLKEDPKSLDLYKDL